MDKLEEKIRKILENVDPKAREIVTALVLKKIKNKEHLGPDKPEKRRLRA